MNNFVHAVFLGLWIFLAASFPQNGMIDYQCPSKNGVDILNKYRGTPCS